MKPYFLAACLVGMLVFAAGALSSSPLPQNSQKASPSAKTSAEASAPAAKDELPFPQVARITAEEVARQMKAKGDVVIVDTDDSETYEAEHIKGAVNIFYDPTGDIRNQDQTLSALPGDKLIVFYCNCPHEEDSAPMVQEMWQLGYDKDKVKALEGGLTRWETLRYPLVGTEVNKNSTKAD